MHLPFWIRLAIALTAIMMGGAWLIVGSWEAAMGVALLASLWEWGRERRSQGLSHAVFVAFLAVAAFGVVRDVLPGAMLAGSLAALTAWDLGALADRLDGAEHATATARLQARHFERLVVVLVLGGTLGGIAMVGSLSVSLAGAIGLGAVAIVGLRWLLRATARNLN